MDETLSPIIDIKSNIEHLISDNVSASEENVLPEISNNFDDFAKKNELINIKKKSDDNYAGPSIINLLLSLGVVIFLILITGWIYSKLSKVNTENLFSGKLDKIADNKFNVISSLQLGQNNSIHLIKINNKQLIVGCTQTNMTLLTEFGSEKEDNDFEKLFNSNIDKNTNTNDEILKQLFNSKEETQIEKADIDEENILQDNEKILNNNIYKKYIES